MLVTPSRPGHSRGRRRTHTVAALVAISLIAAFAGSNAPSARAVTSTVQPEKPAVHDSSPEISTGNAVHERDDEYSAAEYFNADDALPHDGQYDIADATLGWAIKDSFRTYILFSGSSWALNSVTDSHDRFRWSAGTGEYQPDTRLGTVAFNGSIQFTGHEGKLDVTLSDVTIQFQSPSTAVVIATIDALDLRGVRTKRLAVPFVTVALPDVQTNHGEITVVNAPTTLTAEGAAAFAGFYQAGQEMAPLTLKAPLNAREIRYEVVTDKTDSPLAQHSSDAAAATAATPVAAPAPETLRGPDTPAPTRSVDSAETKPDCTAREINNSTLSWAIKDSFRAYVTGPAQGSWQLNSVGDSGGTFRWANGTGKYNNDASLGRILFPGSIHFTGHTGALDLTLSDIVIQFRSSTAAVVIATVDAIDLNQVRTRRSAVQFATVSLSGSEATQSAITITDAATVLTADGATAFAGFYAAGQALAPISLTASLGATTPCDATSGWLATSGTDLGSALPTTAVAFLLVGLCALSRSRVAQKSRSRSSQR